MLTSLVPDQRFVRATAATLSWQGVDSDGEPADPGTVTVGVTASDGTVVVAPGTATSGTGTAQRTYALTSTDTASLDVLTATWTASGVTVGVTHAAVVGGVYATVDELVRLDPALGETENQESRRDRLVPLRSEAETMIEEWCSRAFVPRFEVGVHNGTGDPRLPLRWGNLRRIVWARYLTADGYIEASSDEVASVGPNTAGIATRSSGVWPKGHSNVMVGYEFGLDRPPADIKRALAAVMTRQASSAKAGIDARATSFQSVDGGMINVSTPGIRGAMSGLNEVDETLKRYRLWRPGVR